MNRSRPMFGRLFFGIVLREVAAGKCCYQAISLKIPSEA